MHTLKSGAASLGAVTLRDAALRLETQMKNHAAVAPEEYHLLRVMAVKSPL